MNDLFEYTFQAENDSERPLAERMRPRDLSEFTGQSHLLAPDSALTKAIAADRLFSVIFWGPPGCGKTTLAGIIAAETRSRFIRMSAVFSGVKELRSVIETAKTERTHNRRRTILFVDEIHRFNKAQQDAFLHHVESGLIVLIGATTENPSFEIIGPLLSRCRVFPLEPLSEGELETILQRAVDDSDRGLGQMEIQLSDDAKSHLIRIARGDARTALNALEIAARILATDPTAPKTPRTIRAAEVEKALREKALSYDKSGEEHYNVISAFHKSLRGSDPDAALYWLVRMLEAGEDPLYIARRMVRFASEDVGVADPRALTIALSAVDAYRFLGSPEGELSLAQAAIYLAAAPKSNRVYTADKAARHAVREAGALPVPFTIRNAPTRLMEELGYGEGYKYPHDYEHAYVAQEYLPDRLAGRRFYHPSDRGFEREVRKRMEWWRRRKAEGFARPDRTEEETE